MLRENFDRARSVQRKARHAFLASAEKDGETERKKTLKVALL